MDKVLRSPPNLYWPPRSSSSSRRCLANTLNSTGHPTNIRTQVRGLFFFARVVPTRAQQGRRKEEEGEGGGGKAKRAKRPSSLSVSCLWVEGSQRSARSFVKARTLDEPPAACGRGDAHVALVGDTALGDRHDGGPMALEALVRIDLDARLVRLGRARGKDNAPMGHLNMPCPSCLACTLSWSTEGATQWWLGRGMLCTHKKRSLIRGDHMTLSRADDKHLTTGQGRLGRPRRRAASLPPFHFSRRTWCVRPGFDIAVCDISLPVP